MARAEANWERLVRAALRGERLGSAYGQPVTGIAGNVPSSLGNNVHIEEVLRAADEIQDEDPTIARIRKHFCAAELGKRPRSSGSGVWVLNCVATILVIAHSRCRLAVPPLC
jgi:callose synthase